MTPTDHDDTLTNTNTTGRCEKSLLVVGAGGFTGGFICDEALRRGYRVWAGVRESTSRSYLTHPDLQFAVLDYTTPSSLQRTLRQSLPPEGRWDYIVYNLGATKCLNFSDFNRINHDCLVNFTGALKELDAIPDRLLYMSSLSVMGPGDERGYTPFTEKMPPAPDTRYGTSKLKAEIALQASGIPYIIFRATGIYGPRERDYYLMFKSIRRGFDFSVGLRRQELTFIYVADLARAIFDALQRSAPNRLYLISEPRSYTQKEFRTLAANTLGKRCVVPIKAPLWLLRAICFVSGKIAMLKGRAATLNPDKYRIMRQRNWRVDTTAAREGFGFNPTTTLADGIKRTIGWYRDNGWL